MSENASEMVSGVGSTQGVKEAVEKYDSTHGSYKDAVTENENTDSKLPTTALPKATDPKPFSIKGG